MTTPAPLYACHNKPREAAPYLAQDGYYDAWERTGRTFTRAPRYIEVPHAMSTNCRYDRAHADSRCAGCRSKATGE